MAALEMSSSMEDDEKVEVCEDTDENLAKERKDHHESGDKGDLKITLTRGSVPC